MIFFLYVDATYLEMDTKCETYALWKWEKKMLNVQMNDGRVPPADSIEYVLYQMNISLELKALLPKWNQYFSLDTIGSYAIRISPPFCSVFYVGCG